ncbi:MAG: cyclic nucleotide-binding domain-containing protein, partial [Defluviitaleaceae bacterium]|nr:cyclic nucleotide-binding domain-containing protein [Defluviitaleaceae bacterium]
EQTFVALTEFKQGDAICGAGNPLQDFLFITKGSAQTTVNGRPFRFDKGDAIGLCSLGKDTYSHTYTAVTDVTVFSYPYDGFDSLDTLLRDNADIANLLLNSMCRQISEFLKYRMGLKYEADDAYELVNEVYPEYERLCALYAFTSKKLTGIAELKRAEDAPGFPLVEDWMHDYYMAINELEPNLRKGFFYNHPPISSGFIRRSAEDIREILRACGAYHDYLKDISKILLNSEGHDLFALISELHFNSVNIKGADEAVSALMMRLTGLLTGMTGVDPGFCKKRMGAYKETLKGTHGNEKTKAAPGASVAKKNLADSLSVIIEYSGCPAETGNKFARAVHDFAKISDRNSSEDDVYKKRKELTVMFYDIYQQVFIKSLEDPALSTVIKMFLNFGYVDAALAGHENADYLYSIADSLKGDPGMGVYTVREWLLAIYNGEKEPCRNEYDEDFPAHLRELKNSRKIDDKEEARLLKDNMAKLRFEMDNVFQTVNKVTFGRISTFCPLFGDHNVQRKLEVSLLTPAILKAMLDEIRSLDFSAYYRPTMYSNPEIGIPKEVVNVEVLPDIILMPNVGIRGSMWQDIEGRVRTSPARMFMPMFLQTDLKAMMIQMTAEFRWEICKRIQGTRWNDMSDPSLTSEFCDYLQFYKTNRDLSQEVRAAIKLELVRAKNNFKSVFVLNYAEWMMYESKGSPRLNKNARKIMITYCPFPQEVREKLMQNPQFAEPINRWNHKKQQRTTHLSNVVHKAEQSKNGAPGELVGELEFSKK